MQYPRQFNSSVCRPIIKCLNKETVIGMLPFFSFYMFLNKRSSIILLHLTLLVFSFSSHRCIFPSTCSFFQPLHISLYLFFLPHAAYLLCVDRARLTLHVRLLPSLNTTVYYVPTFQNHVQSTSFTAPHRRQHQSIIVLHRTYIYPAILSRVIKMLQCFHR